MPQAEQTPLEQRLVLARQQNLKPPPKLNLVEWADERRFLSPEGASLPGKWKTSRVEVARGPMMAVSDPSVHTVTVMCCTQLCKTELILNIIGFHIDQDPAPMIVVQPTVHMGEAFSKDRVDPMLRDSPALVGKVPPKRQRDSGNTTLHKQFPGGHLTIVGANAPGDLAMRPVRIILCDEVDKYPESAGEEGDPISIIRERAATFWNYKFVSCCSPTIEGRSRIAFEYEQGDQRVYERGWPIGGHAEEMKWQNVRWKDGKPETALYHCPGCGVGWTEAERRRAVKAAGKQVPFIDADGCFHGHGWRAQKPFKGHASFRVSKLASPWEADSLPKMAAKFLKAKKKPQMLKTFTNTQLAETWKERGEVPEWRRLYEMREPYLTNTLPPVPVILFAGADVQKDRIEVEVYAIGERLQSWSIDYRVFPGSTDNTTAPDSPWMQLDALLSESWTYANGVQQGLRMMAIDAGYNTNVVTGWVRKRPSSRVIAVKGEDDLAVPVGQPKAVEVTTDGKRKSRGAKQWPVGVNQLKTELYGWLRQEKPTIESGQAMPDGWCHFPEYGEEYFMQLTAEQTVTRLVRGYRRTMWEKLRERNEALDCRIYSRAASILCGVDRLKAEDWAQMAIDAGLSQPEVIAETEEPVRREQVGGVQVEFRKSNFWERRR